ncbi:hypothetical protein DMI62_21775 [Escherichia coli]|nr:hypothetical protein [Escherichia coli]
MLFIAIGVENSNCCYKKQIWNKINSITKKHICGDNPNIDVVAMVPIIIVDMKIEVTLKLNDITVGNIMSAVVSWQKTP